MTIPFNEIEYIAVSLSTYATLRWLWWRSQQTGIRGGTMTEINGEKHWKMSEIAVEFGVSRQRISQFLNERKGPGLTPDITIVESNSQVRHYWSLSGLHAIEIAWDAR